MNVLHTNFVLQSNFNTIQREKKRKLAPTVVHVEWPILSNTI